MAKRKPKIKFLMETDWMFEKPIDREHKEYKLLSYFQKMGEKLDKLELYPGFIELSLHLMNLQTLMKERKIIYTDKKLDSIDDELLVRDLKVKDIPELSTEEFNEFVQILSYSAPRIMEYFNVAKSVWTIVFDALEMKVKKNKKNVISKKGFFYFNNKENGQIYVWEYHIKPAAKGSPESKTFVNLIYNDDSKELTIPKIISTFSTMDEKETKESPVFEMICTGTFPMDETLLPLFKKRLVSYINQQKRLEEYEKTKNDLNDGI
jgi:hypothetical protein